MKSFLKLESKTGEELPGNIVSEAGLTELFDTLYDGLSDTTAIEIHVYRKFVLVGTREKGHGDKMVKKFTNFGFSNHDKKSDALSYAIRAIDACRTIATGQSMEMSRRFARLHHT